MKQQTFASSAGLLAAVAASLCCIAPLLALVSGAAGLASGLSWIAPLRPYLIGVSALAIGAAWYLHLRPTTAEACACPPEGRSLVLSRGFLLVVTALAIIFLAAPSLSSEGTTLAAQDAAPVTPQGALASATFQVEGMTCGGCEKHISDAVYTVVGVAEITPSYEAKNTVVVFDPTQTTPETIAAAIATTGYTVTGFSVSEKTAHEAPNTAQF